MPPSLKDELIEQLTLSRRAYNRLSWAGIRTVGQVLAMTDEDLLGVWQLGTGTLKEIREKLAAYVEGYSEPFEAVAEDYAPSAVADPGTPPEPAIPTSPILSSLEVLGLSARSIEALHQAGCQTVSDVASLMAVGRRPFTRQYLDPASWAEIDRQLDAFFSVYPSLSRPISLKVLNLSVRSYNALMRHWVFTVEQLAELSDEQLWRIYGIGAKSFAEIKRKSEAYLSMHPAHAQQGFRPGALEPPPSPLPSRPLADPEDLGTAQEKGIPLDDIVVDRLALSEWARHLLHRARIRTIGELAREPRDKWESCEEISRRLSRYLDWVIGQDETAWASEVKAQGVSPLDRMELREASLERLVERWFETLRDREKNVIRWRYGFDGEALTLEQAGQRLDLTRERIRQIQQRAVRKLRLPHRYIVIRPFFELLTHLLECGGGLLTAEQLGAALSSELSIGKVNPAALAQLACEVCSGIRWVSESRAWGLESFPLDRVSSIEMHLCNVLESAHTPLPFGQVLRRFKATRFYQRQQDELTDGFLAACLKAHPAIETNDGVCSLIRWLGTKRSRIILALREIGQPSYSWVITDQVNLLLSPGERTSTRNVEAIMDRESDVFIHLGRRKYWLRDHVLDDAGAETGADFGDLFGSELARWQEEIDRRQGDSEFDTHAEVDRLRNVGLDFFAD